jgi:hypothetical protein
MGDIKLEFLPNPGEIAEGLGDAGIEMFRGFPLISLAREIGQNSRDAASSLPVKISFDLDQVLAADFPCIEELKSRTEICLSKAEADGAAKAIEFFSEAKRVLNAPAIPVLRISDENTTGLVGPAVEGTPFFSLVKSRGMSQKLDPASGGSFGIGKNAAFANSTLRTVLYSTIYTDREGQDAALFQGCTIFTSHRVGSNHYSSRAFWGDAGFQPLADPSDIPSWARRKTRGTSILVVGFEESEEWIQAIKLSVLLNFFPAIASEEIEFSINGRQIEINKNTIGPMMLSDESLKKYAAEHFQGEALEQASFRYQALISHESKVVDLEVAEIGKVKLHILVRPGAPKSVALIRNGMFITDNLASVGEQFKRFNLTRDFVAVAWPTEEKGRLFLKLLENPEHNSFSALRLSDPAKKSAASRALKNLGEQIRTCIRTEAKIVVAQSSDLPETSKYFNDDGGDGETRKSSEEKRFDPVHTRYSLKPSRPAKPADTHIDQGTSGGDGRGDGHGEGTDTQPPYGSQGPGRSKPVLLGNFRNIRPPGLADKKRKLLFTPSASGRIRIDLSAVGVFGRQSIEVTSAEGADVSDGGLLLDVEMGKRVTITVTFARSYTGPIAIDRKHDLYEDLDAPE